MLNRFKIHVEHFKEIRLAVICGLILVAQPCRAQPGATSLDSTSYFIARIVDSLSRNPVQFAHIVNTDMGYATISDTLGYFYLKAAKNNTLQISAIGYSLKQFTLNDSILSSDRLPAIQLVPYVYPIDAVKINPFGNYGQFRDRFLNLVPPAPKYQISTSVLREIDLGMDTITSLSPTPIGSPVTFFYNLLSREGRSNRKLAELLEEEEFTRKIAHKYSDDLVSRVTGYHGLELYEFMEYCNFTRAFLLKASEYQIVEAILNQQEKYKESREDPNHHE